MKKMRCLAASLLVLGLGSTGCWSTWLAREGQLPPPARPELESGRFQEGEGDPWRRTTGRGKESPDLVVGLQPGPLAFLIRKNPPMPPGPEGCAVLRLDLPVGYGKHPAGLAQLAARAASEIPGAALGRPSMRQAIAALGGNLQVQVDAQHTGFQATVPASAWSEALEAMAESLRPYQLSPQQFTRLQEGLLVDQHRSWQSAPLLGLVDRLIQHGRRQPGRILEDIQDRSLPELMLFILREYQPKGAALGLWIPEMEAGEEEQLVEKAKEALSAWALRSHPAAAGQEKQEHAPELGEGKEEEKEEEEEEETESGSELRGIYWASGADTATCHIALLLPTNLAQPRRLVLEECLTMGGLGGRLGQELRERLGRELVFKVHAHGSYLDRFLVLETEAAPTAVIPLWRALEAAIRSLVKSPARGVELHQAMERAELRLLSRQIDAGAWFEAAELQLMQGRLDGPSQDLFQLRELNSRVMAELAMELAGRPRAMVVLGGEPPAATRTTGSKVVKVVELENEIPSLQQESKLRPGESGEGAEKYLRLAIEALGEQRRLLAITGFEAEGEVRISGDLAVSTKVSFTWPGNLRLLSKLLATEIETVVQEKEGRQSSGEETVTLPAGEVQNWLAAANRHPLALLAAFARGEARYFFVGMRQVGGRKFALLQRIDPHGQRLRLGIDAESGLLRWVETAEHRGALGLVQILERYDDYRTIDALRCPLRKITTVGGSKPEVETVWSKFELRSK